MNRKIVLIGIVAVGLFAFVNAKANTATNLVWSAGKPTSGKIGTTNSTWTQEVKAYNPNNNALIISNLNAKVYFSGVQIGTAVSTETVTISPLENQSINLQCNISHIELLKWVKSIPQLLKQDGIQLTIIGSAKSYGFTVPMRFDYKLKL